ncbi:MAG: HAMP domain-containing protein, partial [Candidatus Limnocylindria bacterium]|nr:HAMP domain-containing protein [Candidatus Limnocylindria bacterium]
MSPSARFAGRALLWLVAALEMTLAAEALLAPSLFAAPIYAPLAPNLTAFAWLALATGLAALAASLDRVPRVARSSLAAVAALTPAGLALVLGMSGSVAGPTTYALLAIALLVVGVQIARDRAPGWRPLPATAGAILALQGLLMLVVPASFSRASYGDFADWLWLSGLLFVAAGAGLLLAERRAMQRAAPAAATFAALCFVALVLVFLETGMWTGVTLYGLLALGLVLAASHEFEPRRAPAQIMGLAFSIAVYHVGVAAAAILGQPDDLSHAIEGLIDVGLALITGGWLLRLYRPGFGRPRLISVLGLLGACASIAAMIAVPDAWLSTAGGLRPGLLLIALSLTLLIDQRWTRSAWLAPVLCSVGSLGVALGLDDLLASMQPVGNAASHVLLSGALEAQDAVVLLGSSVAIGLLGILRAIDGPIKARILAAFGAVALIALVRSLAADAALRDLIDLWGDPPQAHAITARAAATRDLLLVALVAAAAVSATVIATTITRPLDRLLTVISQHTAGDLAARTNLGRSDEIGTVASAIDELADHLGQAEEEQRRLLAVVTENEQHLRNVVDQALDAYVGMDAAGRII